MVFFFDCENKSRPLYLQLADQIASAIESGAYFVDGKLPTETALQNTTGLSKGTIKAAYTHLQKNGIVKKIRGSGVYVNKDNLQAPSQLLTALFDKLVYQYNMTAIGAYRQFRQNLLREFSRKSVVNIALVDSSIEVLHVLKNQLETIPEIQVTPYLLDKLLITGDESIKNPCNLVLTSQHHHSMLCRYTYQQNLVTEAFSVCESKNTLTKLSRLPRNAHVCLVFRSKEFLNNMRYSIRMLDKCYDLVFCHEDNIHLLEEYEQQNRTFFVPPDYLDYCNSQTLQLLFRVQSTGGNVIAIEYEIDQGSIIYISEIIDKLVKNENGDLR